MLDVEYQICAKILCHRGLLRRRQSLPGRIGQSVLFWREYCTFHFLPISTTVVKRSLFSTISHYLSLLRAVLPKSLDHVLTIYWSGDPGIIRPRLAVDFCADGGHYFTGGY